MTDTQIASLFVTRLYRAALGSLAASLDPQPEQPLTTSELENACLSIAEDDEAGQRWCEENAYPGYTSYGSLNDLPWRFPVFEQLKQMLDAHVAAFIEDLQFDLAGKEVTLDSLWINILGPGGTHSGHIHPHSIISGTAYVTMPPGASAIRYEDPRLPMQMAAPGRRPDARQDQRHFVYVQPEPGDVLLWESWLRHEVLLNDSDEERISVSFNYRWG
ncbi:MAG: TIGR02466 family protein [Pseudomonadota bacterium]